MSQDGFNFESGFLMTRFGAPEPPGCFSIVLSTFTFIRKVESYFMGDGERNDITHTKIHKERGLNF